ncbi:PhzF family phenazine biosynthesis isomerase [Cyanobium sp. FACHB-13342]|uniref:PhzF family phenazine biosynthesis protein n=1 Tax=Cyanobium sp. FACHB-13342 TaxID=2692793 RepID=UPI0018EF8A88|nr:PhzF family phenazine biosynthesis isomerase [Cyanobium sp. FACHB-13342]
MISSTPAVLVEAFAAGPCRGNGAAVVLLDQPLGDGGLQAIARSLNQSETAFLLRQQDRWCLRWFTPTCEVPLCGHATLAALLALGHWQLLEAGQPVSLWTRSGPLAVRLELPGGPNQPASGSVVLPSAGLLPAEPTPPLIRLLQGRLGVKPTDYWGSSLGYRIALLPPEAPLAAMASVASELQGPDRMGLVLMQSLEGLEQDPPPSVLGQRADYQLRFFAPGLGIEEDPVTGSAHALVAPFWLDQLKRPSVVGWQCSPRPGGMVLETASSGMIRLSGTGHLLWNGTLHVQADGCGVEPWAALLA